ncbi:MAG TPA: hypothetical protein QF772_03275 [Nitrospinaceae bacterium]|nr:hypothetical protein [Nitrospinota bacterium]MDP6334930.1 hypothetical protein [Nitrospinaceae bacterium]MDP7147476.1 hypothetical protein [Nitrospinaceae bacterium]HAX46471.1 hypothetical protein [Nitrospina sp.]HJO57229.1 hypothetical protein [Nitrospinaceae bacterium]
MNYFTTIEQFFIALKGSGLALSASDYQLIEDWEKRKVPVELVCRSIESGYFKLEGQSRGRCGNISLTQLKVIVEEEIQAGFHRN